jgi:Xaa-Pro aminopeptidase
MNTAVFQQRRLQLFQAMANNSVALIASGKEVIRNRDTHYPFRAQSDFYFLTGFHEPDAVLMLSKTNDGDKTHLWCRAKDKEKEIWDGYRLGIDAAPEALGLDSATDVVQLNNDLVTALADKSVVYFSFEQGDVWLSSIMSAIQQLKRRVRLGISAPQSIHDLDPLLHEQRLIKDTAAQAGLRQAAQVTVAGHLAAMQAAKTAQFEYHLQTALEAAFKQQGVSHQAFNSIVASGENACVLHYNENNAPLHASDLVLIDAGAEMNGYAGDCTHTFPLSGRFSAEQAAIYNLVLQAQQAALKLIQPGTPYDAPHQAAVRVICQGLIELGLLTDTLENAIESGSYKVFYMHQTGHWLGNDVHDVGQYKVNGQWRALKAGMALTVEPGIYISPDNQQVEAHWRGIGVRIEDSVLVTETGYECLTTGLPRSVEEIEAWMQQH